MSRRLLVLLLAALAAAACADDGGAARGTTSPLPTTTTPAATMIPAATTSRPPAAATLPVTSSTHAPPVAVVADHRSVDLSAISGEWLERAAQDVVWAYGSTSHGTQVWTGAASLGEPFPFAGEWRHVPEAAGLRMAYDDGWSWDAAAFYDTAAGLLADAPEANAFMWSWCGELSWDTTAVDAYLTAMAQLEADYPRVTFVYMTGHTDGPADQVLEENNQAIRDYVRAHGKVLYDFADIESWDPAGNHYPDTDDSCPWCPAWCAQHPADCTRLVGECAHSHPFNCILKGRAFWWLSARLAGWDGE